MIIGLDIDDVIFNTSAMVKEVLGKAENQGLNAIKLDVMRGDIKVPGVKEFLQKIFDCSGEKCETDAWRSGDNS